jgi:hypothetical protein
MGYTLEGTVHRIGQTEQKGNFTVREFILEFMDGSYKQYANFQFTQAYADLPDNYKVGDEVRVHFSIKGREWNGKIFSNLSGWKIELVAKEVRREPVNSPPPADFTMPDDGPTLSPPVQDDDDGLPF